ncbi:MULTISPECIES: restriction endonuclease subunit S [unclassified Staphylococcus]|uniref:restriction endonuclease subunit S n=1 Tax=unclassified Staphylococcus TaxID=91994 RepID=UPI001AEBBC7E|nr:MULTISPECIES: restriction endonuclease subunit S [unclassified Staphylococcus]
MEFKEYKLSDLTINGKGEYGIGASAVEYNPSLYRYLRITDIDDNGFINTDELKSVNDKNAENYLLKENEIVFARTGNSTGKSYFYNGEDGPLVFAGFLIRFKLDSKKVNPKFIRYYTLSENYKGWINQFATGSTRKNINAKTYGNMIIKLPPRSYQNYIVQILDSLEEKLKENKKIIANLEELSQTLFKRWFVDFEFPDANGNPYKSSGGEMVDSELGEIPRGWAIGHFNQFCKKPIAGDWGKEHQQGNYNKPVRIIRGADINDYSKGGKGKSPIRFILEKNFDNKKLISGDIIVEISGGSPTQSTGRTLLINKEILQNSNYGLVCTNFCKVIRPVDEKYGEWIAYYFNYLYFRDVFFNYENGTTGIKNLDYKSILNTMKIIVPITQILNNFHNVISNYKINIQRLGKENDYLSQLRDTLLPKLMSGEIEIPDDIEVNEDELSI